MGVAAYKTQIHMSTHVGDVIWAVPWVRRHSVMYLIYLRGRGEGGGAHFDSFLKNVAGGGLGCPGRRGKYQKIYVRF